jgi:hypothetical protein
LNKRQRRFLLRQWEAMVADARTDFDHDGRLDDPGRQFADQGQTLIDWLKGGPKPGADIREFLEERLESFEEVVGYDKLVYEHGAITAAIEELR